MLGKFLRQLTGSLFTFLAVSYGSVYGQATGPDLTVNRSSATTVDGGAYTLVSLFVVNRGNATAPAVNFTYMPPGAVPSIVPTSLYVITPDIVAHGHSGRGGGITYTQVGWFCNRSTPLTIAAGASATVRFYVSYPVGTTNETWTVNAGTTAQLNLVSHVATGTITGMLPPIPSAPTGVAASQAPTTDGLNVSWHAPSVGGSAVQGSTITATPVSGTGTVVLTGAASGLATTASLGGVEPTTTYSITVQCKDLAGTGPASVPITLTTAPSSHVPGAPVITYEWWSGNSLACRWTPPTSTGDSPIDDYEVSATDTDGGYVLNDAGNVTEAFTSPVNPTADSVTLKVRAHNAAGWGAWSAPVVVGGL